VDIFGDGYYWACLWELRVDRAWRRCLRASDQWVQPRGSCRLAALWLCSRCPAQMQNGCEVSLWDPLKEANPRDSIGVGAQEDAATPFSRDSLWNLLRRDGDALRDTGA